MKKLLTETEEVEICTKLCILRSCDDKSDNCLWRIAAGNPSRKEASSYRIKSQIKYYHANKDKIAAKVKAYQSRPEIREKMNTAARERYKNNNEIHNTSKST